MSSSAPKYFKAWIIFFLIATVGGFILGAVTGGFLGLTMGLAHVDLTVIKIVCGVAGFILSIPLSYFTFRWCVGEFIVKDLTQAPPPVPSVPLAPPSEPPPLS